MPRTEQVPRSTANAWSHETVRILESGEYQVGGSRVEIRNDLAAAVASTRSYPPYLAVPVWAGPQANTRLTVVNDTTLASARQLIDAGLNPVALNFASATSPGGGFLTGARAQEESLAWSSGLYATLRDNPMYEFHQRQADPLYSDYAIYSPAVPVIRDDQGKFLSNPWPLSFITSPAPLAKSIPASRKAEIEPAFRRRVARVLEIGLFHGHDAIVLGAWGCGAFGNESSMVAGLFREALHGPYRGAYRWVEFAILDWSPERRFLGPFELALCGG